MAFSRVMIVDDESIIRKGLTQFIDWKSAGCEVVYEAVDGDDAWENIPAADPDIVIADIRMPGRSGLDLIRDIAGQYPRIKVILLTGYADFQYAQQAIHYNVVDFLLKPTQKPQVMAALEKARLLLEKENGQRQMANLLADRSLAYEQLQLDKCLRNLIGGGSCPDPRLETELDGQLKVFYLVLVETLPTVGRVDLTVPNHEPDRTVQATPELVELIRQSFAAHKHYPVQLRNGQIAILAAFPGSQSNQLQIIIDIGEEMIKLAESFLAMNLSIGLSRCHSGCAEIAAACAEAADALAVEFFGGNHGAGAVHLPRVEKLPPLDMARTQVMLDEIMAGIRDGSAGSAVQQLECLFQLFRDGHYAIEDIKDVCILLASQCSSLLSNYNLKISQICGKELKHYTSILEAGTLQALQEILKQLIMAAADLLQVEERHSNSIITKATAYLNEHYAQPIMLHQIADHVHVSPSYLSRLFHRQTGQTIVEVCKAIRLNQACLLLKTTDLKNYEIAARVGIDDPAYFSQLFRKHTGLSPSEYRQKKR